MQLALITPAQPGMPPSQLPRLAANTSKTYQPDVPPHVGSGSATGFCVCHDSEEPWGSQLLGLLEKPTRVFTVPFVVNWAQLSIKAQVSEE